MKTKQVLTWHMPTPEMAHSEAGYQQLLHIWKTRWTSQGWDAAVVGMRHARPHPFYKPLSSKVRTYPTSNGLNYEEGCWIRWLAAAECAKKLKGPVVMADSDVIPYNFHPEDTAGFDQDVHVLDRFGVPCMVYVTPEGAEHIASLAMSYNPPPGTTHVSDMIFFIEELVTHGLVHHGPWYCYLYGDNNFPDWRTAKAVHFSASACRGHGQHKVSTVMAHVHGNIG